MLSGSMRFGRSAGDSSGSKSAAHRRGLRLSEDPALPSRRSPARGLIDHCRARFATNPSRESSYHWSEGSCDVGRVGMSQAPRPLQPGAPGESPPVNSPPSAPAGSRRRSALIAVACERCRKKKAKVHVGTVIHPIMLTKTCERASS